MYHRKAKGWIKNIDLILFNLVSLHLALMLSYYIHIDNSLVYNNTRYLNISVIITMGAILSAIVMQPFASYKNKTLKDCLINNLKQVIIVDAIAIFYFFGTQQGINYSRVIFSLYLPCFYYAFNLLIFYSYDKIRQYIKTDIQDNKSLLILTNKDYFDILKEECCSGIFNNYRIIDLLLLDNDVITRRVFDEVKSDEINRSKYGLIDDYLAQNKSDWIDEILVVSDSISEKLSKILEDQTYNGTTVHFALTNLFYKKNLKQITNRIGSYITITTTLNYMSYEQSVCKRLIDIIGALVGCGITAILFIIFAPMIYKNSPGPIFFKQKRIGKHGKIFNLYKFRTMYLDAEERKKELLAQNIVKDGMMFKMTFDPRIIGNKILSGGQRVEGIGSFLRKYSLDEFPQFFNVLKGDMSIVGTRPPTLDEWEKYSPYHKSRLFIKPGITGMWQVSGRNAITNFDDVVALDRKYITEWSIKKDIEIIIKTIKVVINHKNSY